MNQRNFLVLAAIAALLGILAVVAQRDGSQSPIAGASAGDLLLPSLADAIGNVDEIRITGPGRETRVTLVRNESGWTVSQQDDYPAAAGMVGGLLIDLAEARIVEEKTANPEFFDRLGVEPVDAVDAAGLEITLAGVGDNEVAIVLGDSYGNNQRYARLAESDLSVLIDRDPNVAGSAADWVLPGIIDIDAARIREVEVRHADGETLVLRKDSADAANFTVAGIPADRELQYAAIPNVTGSVLQDLSLEEVVRAGSEPGDAVATIVFSTFDGLVVTVTATDGGDGDPWLAFSAAGDGGSDAVATEAAAINERLGGWRYRIPSFKYGQLTRRMDDLLRDPPAADE